MHKIIIQTGRFVLTGILLATLVAGSGCQRDQSSEAEAALRAFHRAFDQKDLTALKTLCSAEMFWYTLNGKALQPPQFDAFFTPMLQRWENLQTTLQEVQLCGHGRFMTARYKSIILITSNGSSSAMHNLHTMILIKEDGAWKVWQHHMSKE